VLKIILNNGFITCKNFMNIRFAFKWIKPDIFGKVINKYNIVFEAIRRQNWRRLNIRENNLQRMCGYKGGIREW